MSERFFVPEPIATERVTLAGPEAHHLLHVLRAKPGERVTLFDGGGSEFAAEILSLGRAAVELQIVERRDANRELPVRLVAGVALPKGDRQKWLVEKLTELGATELVPLVTERGVAQPTDGALERLRRAVIEASKQCGRNRLMTIAKPQAWAEWAKEKGDRSTLASAKSEPTEPSNAKMDLSPFSVNRFVAHPGGKPIAELSFAPATDTCLAIGPEGGLIDDEVSLATAAGWQTVDLGPRILRVETAAVALTAAICLGK